MAQTEERAQADYSAVLRAVQQWPAEARKETWRRASGLLAGDWPPPMDE